MNTKTAAHTLGEIIKQKQNQGYAVRIGRPDYDTMLRHELARMEEFSDERTAELKCLSKCIRQFLWKSNTERLYSLMRTLNDASEILAVIITPEVYWSLDTIVDYVNHLRNHADFLRITNNQVFDEIIDRIMTAGAEEIISKQWASVLESDDGRKSFIDVFDDVFQNAIEKYESSFIHSVEDTDMLCRMVKEKSCVEDRFIPWPNKVHNRWNPPGKTYLYLSYNKEEQDYDGELTLSEYVCLLECKLDSEADVCFCRFKPTVDGKILDLSYNDVRLHAIRNDLSQKVEQHTKSIVDIALADSRLLKLAPESDAAKKRIQAIVENNPIDSDLIAVNSAKQILKLICSCIYKKVDEKDPAALEKAYKSFQLLAEYLENKGITGIIYPCTRTNKVQGKNIVLFDIQAAEPIAGSIKPYHFGGEY